MAGAQVVRHREAGRLERVPLARHDRRLGGDPVAQLGVDRELADPPPLALGVLVEQVRDQVHARHGDRRDELHRRDAGHHDVLANGSVAKLTPVFHVGSAFANSAKPSGVPVNDCEPSSAGAVRPIPPSADGKKVSLPSATGHLGAVRISVRAPDADRG